jgi:intein/homing endonuclease
MEGDRSAYVARALARKQQHIREAQRDVNVFIEYCLKDGDGNPIKQGAMHREWQMLGDRYKRLMVIGPKLHGKCLAAGSRVLAADGEMIPIERWDGRDLIAWDLDRWEFTRAASTPVVSSGVKPIYELRTITGKRLRLTDNHPLLTFGGWQELKSLAPGDFVAVPRGIGCIQSSSSLSEAEAFLLGYLVGDGSTTTRVAFTNADPEILAHVCSIVNERGWTFNKMTGPYHWHIGGKQGAHTGGPTHWARAHGLLGKKADDKRVPDAIWRSSPLSVLCFIAGYFAADGTVNPLRGGAASLASKSRALLGDVQLLLQRFGVVSTLRKKNVLYKGVRRPHWRMFVRGRDLRRFATLLPLMGAKRERLRSAGQAAVGGVSRLHRIPNEWRGMLHCSQKALRKKHGLRVDYKLPMMREKVRRAAIYDDHNPELLRLVNAPITWDQIEDITHVGNEPVYDISVPAHSNFVAEGVIVHNSQQALGRVLFKLGQDRNQMIKLLCASDAKGMKRMEMIRKNLESNSDLHAVFPHLSANGIRRINKKHLYLERASGSGEPSVEAKGITGSATGDRATGIVADDAVDYRNSVMQPRMRESIKGAWGDWYSLLPPTGWLYWISNLWHPSDATHMLMANPAYAVAKYEIDPETFGSKVTLPDGTVRESDQPLWPEMYGKKELAEAKRVHKAQMFARLFSLRPMSISAQKIDFRWIKPWETPPDDDWDRLLILDLAESEEEDADMIGAAELAVHPKSPIIKIENAYHLKMDFDAKVKHLRDEHREKRFKDIVLEKSAGALSLEQHAVRRYRLPIRLLPVGGRSKRIWLEDSLPYFKGGVIEWHPWLYDNTGELGEHGDGIAELVNFGSYPTDNIMDAITRGIYWVVNTYEVFDDVDLDGDDYDDRPLNSDDEDYDDLDDDCEVILI